MKKEITGAVEVFKSAGMFQKLLLLILLLILKS